MPDGPMRMHLASESKLNLGPYGILTGFNMRNEWRNKGFQKLPNTNEGHSGPGLTADGFCNTANGSAMAPPPEMWRVPGNDCTQFGAMSMTHSALALWLGVNASEALKPALRFLGNARDTIADWFDFTDLYYGPGNVCSQPTGPRDMSGLPLFNSNYARHQIGAAMVNAMNGQQWDATSNRLSFSFAEGAPDTVPFATAFAAGRVRRSRGSLEVEVAAGELNVAELLLDGKVVGSEVRILEGETHSFAAAL